MRTYYIQVRQAFAAIHEAREQGNTEALKYGQRRLATLRILRGINRDRKAARRGE